MPKEQFESMVLNSLITMIFLLMKKITLTEESASGS